MKRYSIIIGGVIVAVLVIIIIANGYKFNAQPQRETAVPDPIPASIKDTKLGITLGTTGIRDSCLLCLRPIIWLIYVKKVVKRFL
jgi:hypothetical protein